MKITISLIGTLIVFVCFSTNAFANDADCFRAVDEEWGTKCNSSDSFSLNFLNTCSSAKDFKGALKRTDGRWSGVVSWGVGPGQKANAGTWVCHATGEYKWWARPVGSSYKFPRDSEIY